jgi:hypothetical protein
MCYTKLETYKVLVIQHEHVILTQNGPPFVKRKVNERIKLCTALQFFIFEKNEGE